MSHFSTHERWGRVSLSRARSTSPELSLYRPELHPQRTSGCHPYRRDCIPCLFQRWDAVKWALVLTLKTPCLCPFWCVLHPLSLEWSWSFCLFWLATSWTGHYLNLYSHMIPESREGGITWGQRLQCPEARLEMSHSLAPCYCQAVLTSMAGCYNFLRGAENLI